MTSELSDAAVKFVRCFRALWLHPDFKPGFGGLTGERVVTEAAADAQRLPHTGRAVRGTGGVQVQVRDVGPSWGTPTLHNVVFDSLIRARSSPKADERGRLEAIERDAHEAYIALRDTCLQSGELGLRLFESRAFKHHEPDEARLLVARAEAEGFEDFPLAISPVVEDALTDAGFLWDERATFNAWEDTGVNMARSLAELEAREFHEYDVLTFLNGPLVDHEQPIAIGHLPSNPEAVVTICYADDSTLRRARHEGFSLVSDPLPASIRSANTVVTIALKVHVNAPVEAYLSLYPEASQWMVRVLDVLRIAHPAEIGISGLRISPHSRYTPMIRRSHSWEFEPDSAPLRGRRTIFPPPAEVVADEEIEVVRSLLPTYLAGLERKGLDVALHRFRDSYDRYAAGDPNRLLDVAIAFEALLLNDGPNKELSYRLSLRGARWLNESAEDRRHSFRVLQTLYEMRSKIAHGATFNTLRSKDLTRLRLVLTEAPALLRRALRHVLEGRGPSSMSDEQLREWWMTIELS